MNTPVENSAVEALSARKAPLSFTRLSRYELCPLAYFLHYIQKLDSERGIPLRFGTLVHTVLERLIREVMDDEYSGPLSETHALDVYRDVWSAEGLTGFELFEEGLRLVRNFIRDQGLIDHRDVLAVEQPFELPVGQFTVIGYIDRVDWVARDTIRIIDYKTNRQLFTGDEVDSSLQLSLYQAAAQRIWPWAKHVELSFWMLRHGLHQETARTPEQLEASLVYAETLGLQAEAATEFPARLNPNCSYCDHRKQCPAYADALKGKRDFICDNLDDLEAVAREREEVAHLAKALDSRKKELERVLKEHLKHTDELVLAGTKYRMFHATSLDYPLGPTLDIVGGATELPREQLIEQIAAVDKDSLDAVLKEFGKTQSKARLTMLKAELQTKATKRYTPRLWAKEA